MMTELT